MNEVVQCSLEALPRISEPPDPPIALDAKETTHGARLVAMVDHRPPHRPAAFAGGWVDRLLAERGVLYPADCSARSAFSSPIDFGRGRAGNVEDARLAAAPAEHALFHLKAGTLGRCAAAHDEVSNSKVVMVCICHSQGSLDGPRLTTEVADCMGESESFDERLFGHLEWCPEEHVVVIDTLYSDFFVFWEC